MKIGGDIFGNLLKLIVFWPFWLVLVLALGLVNLLGILVCKFELWRQE